MIKKILFIFLLSISALSLFSHGVEVNAINNCIGVEAKYGSGIPISKAEVTVYSPLSGNKPFLTGITDKNGLFLFVPDSDGEWKLVVNDGTGHGGTIKIIVKDKSAIPGTNIEKPLGRGIKIVSGISVFFGLSGFLFYILTIRERKRSVNAHS